MIAGAVIVLAAIFLSYQYTSAGDTAIELLPQMFQHFNPFFVVALTPVSLAIFGALASRGKEPSAPRKIGIGMLIAALGFGIMAFFSFGLPTPNPDGATSVAADVLVSPWVLINTYLVLTFAELFLSPMGISFVSKVAPPKYQGIMQGGWLGATALGNQLLFIGAVLYESIPIWMTWTVFVVACCISMFTMLFMLKWLERVAK